MSSYQERRKAFRLSSMLHTIFYIIAPPIIFGSLLLALACMYYYVHFNFINPVGNPNSHFSGDSTTKTFTLFNSSEAVVHYHDAEPHAEYTLLEPGALLVGEVVRNPALDNFEDCFLEEEELAQRVFPSACRYLLHKTDKGKRYELHISYPGSPPVGFHLLLYHVRSSSVKIAGSFRNEPLKESKSGNFSGYKTTPGSSHMLLDTEVRMIAMDRSRSNQYNSQQTIHYDFKDLEKVKDVDTNNNNNDNNNANTTNENKDNILGVLNKVSLGEPEEDPFVAVVEVRPYVLAFSSESPCLFPVMVYNIQLEDLAGNLLPMTIMPIILAITAIMIFASALLWFVCQKGLLMISTETDGSEHRDKNE